jgi:hypothetical protein
MPTVFVRLHEYLISEITECSSNIFGVEARQWNESDKFNWFFMKPSIATKFQYVKSLLFSFSLTTCFGPHGHLQVRYTIRYFNGLFLIQRIRCTYTIWYRDVICCALVLQLVVLIHVIKLNVNIKNNSINTSVRNQSPYVFSLLQRIQHYMFRPIDRPLSSAIQQYYKSQAIDFPKWIHWVTKLFYCKYKIVKLTNSP